MARTRTLEQQLPTVSSAEDLRVLSEGLADEHPEVREQCAQKLAALKDPEAAAFLRHALDDDAEPVRVWGAYGLGLLSRREDRDELARAARGDESPLVRVWACFGLANLGDGHAVSELVSYLDLPDLELKSNAADALLSLADVSTSRPLLEKRLASDDLRKRAWAAAILHRFGHKGAFEQWRAALLEPETRVDAAMAATHLRTAAAARELVRVTSELSQDELESAVPAANDLPLAEVLTSPLLDLDLGALTEEARSDATLRADLLLLLMRGPISDPEVLGRLYEFVGSLDTTALGADVAELLAEQENDDRPYLLARLVEFAPAAVEPALVSMEPDERTDLLEVVAAAAHTPDDATAGLAPLYSVLREGRFAQAFAELPVSPWGAEETSEELEDDARADLERLADEDDLSLVVEQMVAGEAVTEDQRKAAEAMLRDLGMTAEEFVESLAEGELEDEATVAPDPEQVALRALALGALQERARIEEEVGERKLSPEAARTACQALIAWLEGESILDVITPLELDLLEADPGDWLDEDLELVDASTEALAVMEWALGLGELPPPDREVEPAAVMKRLPLLAATEKFVARATLRDPEELERAHDVYETLLWAAAKLAEEGQLPQAEGDFGFEGKPLTALADEDLMAVLALAHERHRALGWMLEGGDWDELPFEEDTGGEGLDDDEDDEG